jgi:predicted negative regulator of RcsB-dependent stress response
MRAPSQQEEHRSPLGGALDTATVLRVFFGRQKGVVSGLTRHELKEQLQHDRFTDTVSEAVSYAASHRESLIRWSIIAGAALVLIGVIFWYRSYQDSIRQQDLEAAFRVLDTPVGAATGTPKSFATEDQKRQESIKTLSGVIAKDDNSRQGLIARYYLGTLKAQKGDSKGAEADLRAVADSSNEVAPLAKLALAQLLAGENRRGEARTLLTGMVNKPSRLVSKEQAQIMLAQLEAKSNPQSAKAILNSLKAPQERPAVGRAVDQLSQQIGK